MNNSELQAIGIDAAAFERASEAQVIGWAENNTTAGFGLCEAALVWLKARYKHVCFMNVFSGALDSVGEEHKIIRDAFVYRLRPGYQPDRFWLCQASNTGYTSPNALDSSGTPDIEITERYAKYVNNPPPGACEFRTPAPADTFFDLRDAQWTECFRTPTAREKVPAFRWCKFKTRWWFNTTTKTVFTCDNGVDRPSADGVVREVSEAYAEYLTSKPEGSWELKRFKKDDVLLAYSGFGQILRAMVDSQSDRLDDLGYRWCKVPEPPQMSLKRLLEFWAVHEPGMWDNEKGPQDWYAVDREDAGIVAYFGKREDAYRFRLAEINRALND